MTKNKLDVEGAEQCVKSFSEEFAQEFGVFSSVQEMDAKAKDMKETMKCSKEKEQKKEK
ncbi:hypothetical protein ACFPU1_05175 [Thalassorhabdus alkalitolerans]|uniref:Phasin protein n=1 Tax=Thalassorhabdus alkalitolerans TaxID=2282697 RepID=A0ABW0YM23_9BACI